MASTGLLRANSRARAALGSAGVAVLEDACGAFDRILPHVQLSAWRETDWVSNGVAWDSPERTKVRVTIAVGDREDEASRSLTAMVERRHISGATRHTRDTIDSNKFDLCKLIASRISEVVTRIRGGLDTESLRAISKGLDESVVARHVHNRYPLAVSVADVLDAFRTLAEQSYENKALTFGCLLDSKSSVPSSSSAFPSSFLSSKRYKALSDGYRTAYQISKNGAVVDFVDLESVERRVTGQHYFPDWSEPMAGASHSGKCGIVLSRQGEVLVFYDGTLRFSYRHGRWQYWNHGYLVHLLRDLARAQHVPVPHLGRVVGKLYRAALDVSFRRSGGSFLILRNRSSLRAVVREGDAIGDSKRGLSDSEFDRVIRGTKVDSLPRSVLVELASLDGAVVLDNSGRIVAFGSVLQPRRRGRLHATEGSRTKAAIGASNYGLAIKVSSDGDITAYHRGKSFVEV